jgi:glucose-6-phosphate isomerase
LPLSEQTVRPGRLERQFQQQLADLLAKDAGARLFAKDLTLWPKAPSNRKTSLDWLDLPDSIGEIMSQVKRETDQLPWLDFKAVLFIGMGSANLAAHAARELFRPQLRSKVLVLDTTDPAMIRQITAKLDLRRTLSVFASKSGKRIETHALLLYFLDQFLALGVAHPGKQFVAGTEDDSYLSVLAKEYRFLALFHDKPGIGSRYSGLIHCNLLLEALAGANDGLPRFESALQTALGNLRLTA